MKNQSKGVAVYDLDALSNEINKIYQHAGKVLAEAQISIGHRLLQARTMFKGDKEFGQWREQNTPIRTASVALNLMKVAEAEQTGKLPPVAVESMSWTALLALSRVDEGHAPEVIERVEKAIAVGRTPTTAEVKTIARMVEEASEAVYEELPKPQPKGLSLEKAIQILLDTPFVKRIELARECNDPESEYHALSQLDKISLALVIIGLGGDTGYCMSSETAGLIFTEHQKQLRVYPMSLQEFYRDGVKDLLVDYWGETLEAIMKGK